MDCRDRFWRRIRLLVTMFCFPYHILLQLYIPFSLRLTWMRGLYFNLKILIWIHYSYWFFLSIRGVKKNWFFAINWCKFFLNGLTDRELSLDYNPTESLFLKDEGFFHEKDSQYDSKLYFRKRGYHHGNLVRQTYGPYSWRFTIIEEPTRGSLIRPVFWFHRVHFIGVDQCVCFDHCENLQKVFKCKEARRNASYGKKVKPLKVCKSNTMLVDKKTWFSSKEGLTPTFGGIPRNWETREWIGVIDYLNFAACGIHQFKTLQRKKTTKHTKPKTMKKKK